ncbi:MAG: sugar phosphate isomerase/epimerase [Anaerolineae bacterium]|jgi:sugar phosphate isomerase/epimerase|nr:sugar phosphate isomerase/epimerase [Anaerolineae bacterium]
MSRIPIALQLYSVREACQADFPKTLKAVADMGYEGVDFAGYYGYEAKAIRTMLDDLGLGVAGCHTGINTLTGDELKQTVEFNAILGNRYLVVPWIPEEHRSSPEAWRRTADLLNEIAAKLEPFGMVTGYHNHWEEFAPFPTGQIGWDILFSHTRRGVIMQIDLGNAMHGGADPVMYLKRYPRRATTVHLKEYAADKELVLIGDGDVKWKEVFDVVEGQGATDWYIVEQENYPYPPLESAERSLKALKAMGK